MLVLLVAMTSAALLRVTLYLVSAYSEPNIRFARRQMSAISAYRIHFGR